jgi:hypothetical protein
LRKYSVPFIFTWTSVTLRTTWQKQQESSRTHHAHISHLLCSSFWAKLVRRSVGDLSYKINLLFLKSHYLGSYTVSHPFLNFDLCNEASCIPTETIICSHKGKTGAGMTRSVQ